MRQQGLFPLFDRKQTCSIKNVIPDCLTNPYPLVFLNSVIGRSLDFKLNLDVSVSSDGCGPLLGQIWSCTLANMEEAGLPPCLSSLLLCSPTLPPVINHLLCVPPAPCKIRMQHNMMQCVVSTSVACRVWSQESGVPLSPFVFSILG